LSKQVCEKAEGQRVRGSKEERLGAYSIRENRTTAADEEICRPSGFAAQKHLNQKMLFINNVKCFLYMKMFYLLLMALMKY
ncbi:hypothetical protein, partial [Psychrobacillus sp. NPDC093200]|uniref:hypothetical protein n=1 Tax=Psychrobacillus sp. NPDC093200 TaxID=3390656 RepID=UPI003D047E39